MIAAGIGIIGTATAATAYLRSGGKEVESDNSEPVLVDAPTEEKESQRTWKESARRTEGRDGYVFGDVTRGVVARVWGTGKETVDEAAEAAKIEADADEKHSHIQLLIREAVVRAQAHQPTALRPLRLPLRSRSSDARAAS